MEFPPLGATVARGEQLTAFGWALAGTGLKEISFWLGEKQIARAALGCPRPDVAAIHPEYPDSEHAGFEANLLLSTLGRNEVVAKFIANDGETATVPIPLTVVPDTSTEAHARSVAPRSPCKAMPPLQLMEDQNRVGPPPKRGVLAGSPAVLVRSREPAVPVETTPTEQQNRGSVICNADPVSDGVVTGWGCDITDPDRPAELIVAVDGRTVGRVACDQAREQAPEGLNGATSRLRGFRYEIPETFRDGQPHTIVLRDRNGFPVPFSAPDGSQETEFRFSLLRGSEIEGFVDGLVAGGIAGWAVRRDLATGHFSGGVELLVICNDEPIGRITADRFRPDVGEAKRCEPNVGFNFQPPPRFRTGRSFVFSFRVLPENTELHRSPFATSFPTIDMVSSLHALHEVAQKLCTEVWALERQVQQMISAGPYTVREYDGWARRCLTSLQAAVTMRRQEPPASVGRKAVKEPPTVSVVMPTFKPKLAELKAAVESVLAQSFRNWELLIVDDCSRSAELTAYLRAVAAADSRIKVMRHATNKGISAATNTAIAKASGDYVALFDHDDLLVDVALEVMVDAARRTGAALLYSDEDKIDEHGHFSEPHFKPDWNWRLLLGMNYLCHLTMVEGGVLREVGPLRSTLDGAQDHDLFLRVAEVLEPTRIHHVPEVLYHWRKSGSSTASSAKAKPYTVKAGIGAVREHLARRGFSGARVSAINGLTLYSVDWRFDEEPSVVVIIPFRDQAEVTRKCLDRLLANTDYGNFRIVLVDNWSQKPETQAFCAEVAASPGVSVMRVEEKFNFSRLNNQAVAANPAEYYVFLNNDVFATQRNWLRVMVDEALAEPKVGIVGPKLTYPNGTLQHGGIVLGVGGIAEHVFKGHGLNDPGYVGRAFVTQQYSAVTAACMLCRADVFAFIGGFDEIDLSVAFNDVDLCLKAGQAGYKVVWTAEVTAEHHESLSRGVDVELSSRARFFHEHQVMLKRWGQVLSNDPFYNKNFSRLGGMFKELLDPPQPLL